MKIPISLMKEGENPFSFQSGRDHWLRELIHSVQTKGPRVDGELKVELRLTKLEPDYYLRGRMDFNVQQECARCTEDFSMPIQHGFELAFAHVKASQLKEAKLSEESDDLDINFFTGNDITIAPVVEEQFFLSLPFTSLCKPDCKGLCQKCGKNLNVETCKCGPNTDLNPFSILNRLKNVTEGENSGST